MLFATKEPAEKRILREIKKNPGITSRELSVKVTHKFSARISDLRKKGYDIRPKRVWRNGKKTGFYGYYLLNSQEYGDD